MARSAKEDLPQLAFANQPGIKVVCRPVTRIDRYVTKSEFNLGPEAFHELPDLKTGTVAGQTFARLFVAEDEGRLLGTLIAGFDGWRGNMYGMAVEPDQRRRGVGTALVRHAETWLRAGLPPHRRNGRQRPPLGHRLLVLCRLLHARLHAPLRP